MPRIFKKATNEWSTNRIVNFTITSQSNEKGAAAVTATPSISWRAIPDETGHPIKDARIFLSGCEPETRDHPLQVSLPQHRHTEEA